MRCWCSGAVDCDRGVRVCLPAVTTTLPYHRLQRRGKRGRQTGDGRRPGERNVGAIVTGTNGNALRPRVDLHGPWIDGASTVLDWVVVSFTLSGLMSCVPNLASNSRTRCARTLRYAVTVSRSQPVIAEIQSLTEQQVIREALSRFHPTSHFNRDDDACLACCLLRCGGDEQSLESPHRSEGFGMPTARLAATEICTVSSFGKLVFLDKDLQGG